ncbi:MAG: hypothetical protein PHW79_10420, partial [Candidatus Marinimicrobia bacterium]|nr:hypothetical protein [Candidatus Neomarinimicrobiota bacterium]
EGTVQNDLGKRYQEEFRKYLIGEMEFPKNVFISLFVSEEKDLYPILVLPRCNRHEGVHLHHFYIPGIEIKLFIGNQQPVEFECIRKEFPDEVLIFLESFKKSDLWKALVRSARNAKYKGKLKKMSEVDLRLIIKDP